MPRIILDFGSGNTCHNDKAYIKRMIDELNAIDTGKHEIIIKWQLFEKAGKNIPLQHDIFDYAYCYGVSQGYATTASVFDKNSLEFLIQYQIPFVKIANRRELDWLIGEIPREVPVYVSYGDYKAMSIVLKKYYDNIIKMACISDYPATLRQYEIHFEEPHDAHKILSVKYGGISDHTIGLDLFKKYRPNIWEKHYKLSDSIGLDAGEFAITSGELAEIL